MRLSALHVFPLALTALVTMDCKGESDDDGDTSQADTSTGGLECPEEGVEGCPCRIAGKCDGDLVCELGLCVQPPNATESGESGESGDGDIGPKLDLGGGN